MGVAAFAVPAVSWQIARRGERAARETMQSQKNVGRQDKAEQACEELAGACHAFTRVLTRLPRIDAGAREALLDEAFTAVRVAYDAVAFRSPPAVAAVASQLYACVEQSERWALSAAVVRSAMSELKRHWCPGTEGGCDGNAEVCTDERHWAAFMAWELLEKWGDLDDWEQFEQRGVLEDALAMSRALSDVELLSLRDELNWGVLWDELTGNDTRSARQLRDALAAFVDESRRELSVA